MVTCGAGQFVETSVNQCRACPKNTYMADTEHQKDTCVDHQVCGQGQFETRPATDKQDRLCGSTTDCNSDQYRVTEATSTADHVCEKVRDCAPGTRMTAQNTKTTDRECKICEPKSFTDTANMDACTTMTMCKENQCVHLRDVILPNGPSLATS